MKSYSYYRKLLEQTGRFIPVSRGGFKTNKKFLSTYFNLKVKW